jgi:predicted transcriptional regulator
VPPTTLKLPADLKKRVQRAAASRGDSPHSFMLKAIETETALAEQRRSFVAEAREAMDDFDRTGLAYDATEVHAYLRARAAGRKATRPKAKRWPR